MTDDPLILWLDHGSAPGNPLLGGKFASLAEMTAAGFSVPPGFGVTTAAYRAFMEHADLRPEAERVRNAARDMAVVDIGKDRARLVEAIGASPMPEALETAVRHGYRLLEERTGWAGVPVAVRSSGEAGRPRRRKLRRPVRYLSLDRRRRCGAPSCQGVLGQHVRRYGPHLPGGR